MKNFSLNKRLVLAALGSQILLAICLVIVGTSFSGHFIRSAFDVYIQGRAESIAALVYYPDDGSPGLLFNEAKVPPSPHRVHQEIFLVTSNKGDFERHSALYTPHMFDGIPAGARFWSFVNDGETYRAIVLRNVAILDTEEGEPLPLPKLTVIYAAPTMDIRHQLTNLAILIAIVSLLILAPTLSLAVWSIRRALAPLNDLTATASTVSVDRWQFEPSALAQSTEELQPLIRAIQTVLEGLEAAFTRQRQFLGDAAHELKTSLAILKSTLQAQLTKPRENEEYKRGLVMIGDDCDRLERLLNRMLQTARAEQRVANGPDQLCEPQDLATTCEEAIARISRFAAAKGVAIDFVSSSDAQVRAEPADLELIWLNLLENAIQYSPVDSVIEMRLSVLEDWAQIEVADRGCGIDAAHLPHIFKRFYRADSSRSRSTGGSGLGLAITKSLVDFYGGRIHAESEPGSGTRITVALPLAGESAAREQSESRPVLTPGHSAGKTTQSR